MSGGEDGMVHVWALTTILDKRTNTVGGFLFFIFLFTCSHSPIILPILFASFSLHSPPPPLYYSPSNVQHYVLAQSTIITIYLFV